MVVQRGPYCGYTVTCVLLAVMLNALVWRLFRMSGCVICVAGRALTLLMLYISRGTQCVTGSMR